MSLEVSLHPPMIYGLKPSTADMLIHSNLKQFDEYSLVDLPVVVDAHVIVSWILDYPSGAGY